jgi:hypothetical protein
MSTPRKKSSSGKSIDVQELREEEVLRANRELAAYFKGRRTEREARAALKIIKAFIRDREHLDPARRRPLPGTAPARKAAPRTRKKGRTSERSSRPRSPINKDGVGEHRRVAVGLTHDEGKPVSGTPDSVERE